MKVKVVYVNGKRRIIISRQAFGEDNKEAMQVIPGGKNECAS